MLTYADAQTACYKRRLVSGSLRIVTDSRNQSLNGALIPNVHAFPDCASLSPLGDEPETNLHCLLALLLQDQTALLPALLLAFLLPDCSSLSPIGDEPETKRLVTGRLRGSIRQHTSAYVSIRQRQHTSAYVSIRQHTSAYANENKRLIKGLCVASYQWFKASCASSLRPHELVA